MTPENENNADVHPFTEDAPAGQRMDEPLAPEPGDEVGVPGDRAGAPYDEADVADHETGMAGQRVEDLALFDESTASEFQQRWSSIQAEFVEDPEGAVRLAGDLTERVIDSLTRVLEDRRQSLDASAKTNDTEQLRLVLRQYRDVLESVTSL